MSKSVKSAALKFLKIRPRSITELKEKLEIKGFSHAEIETTANDLIASGLLDDRAFTKSWINYRLARPFGFRRIIQELKHKGIDQQIIDQAIKEIDDQYDPEKIAVEIAKRRWQRLPDIGADKKKKRVMDFLLRRGFEADIVLKILRNLE